MPNSSIQTKILNKLAKSQLFYVCRDIERTMALADWPKCFIIANHTEYGAKMAKKYKNIILIKEKEALDTWPLLQHKKTKTLIKKNDFVLVFKNTVQIEKECDKNGWQLLNPSAALANQVEEKISQIEWLGPLKKYLPDYKVDLCKNIKWTNKHFILQFNRSHTGSGTILITSKKQLKEIKNTFPDREARIAPFITGPLFTNNNTVWDNKVLQGNISYQITGLKPFTDIPFATIGNDWALPHKILTATQLKRYQQIAEDVGLRLAKSGWKGLFGIDVVKDEKTGQLYLLEINARQPASTTYESELQGKNGECTTFEAHLASLLNIDPDNYNVAKITDGAQIIQRMTKDIENKKLEHLRKNITIFEKSGVKTILYNNRKNGADWLRIQTKFGLMENHNVLSNFGNEILNFVTVATREDGRWGSDRAGIILIKNGKILLMKRNKYGKKFFAIPAGTVEPGESLKTTALRETKEETNLDCEIDESKKPIKIVVGLLATRDEYYFIGKNIRGTAKLGGPELGYNSKDNLHELEWVDLKKLNKINFLPKQLSKILI